MLGKFFLSQIWKAVRSTVITTVTAAIVQVTNNPEYAAIVPLITTLSGWLRKKYPGRFDWLPV